MPLWITSSLEAIDVSSMTDRHLANVIAYLDRRQRLIADNRHRMSNEEYQHYMAPIEYHNRVIREEQGRRALRATSVLILSEYHPEADFWDRFAKEDE